MKKKVLYILSTIIVCASISALIEAVGFNFKTLSLGDSDQSISEASYTTEKTDDKQTKITLDINQQYVRELVIDYYAAEDTSYRLIYTHSNTYGQETKDEFEDIFDSTFNTAITNIDSTVSELSVIFNNTSKIKINRISIDNDFHFNYYRAIFIFLSLLAACSLFFFYKDGFRTEKIHIYFAIICSLLGLMIIIAQPSMSFFSWDDQIHFDRIVSLPPGATVFNNGEYQMSNGSVPNNTWPDSTNSFGENTNRLDFLNSKNNSSYTGYDNGTFLFINKIPYVPMAIGYHFSKFIGLPFSICFQIGKIINLMIYVLLMSYAIKTIVVGKRLLTVLALIPTNIFSASEYCYDPFVFAGLTIFLVQIINIFLDKSNTTKLDFKRALIMIVSMTYACLAKAVYAPFLLLTLLIPKDKFTNIKQNRLVKIGFVVITILLCSTLLLPGLDGSSVNDSRGGETSAIDQASLIITHPIDYASILKNTAVDEFGYKFFSPDTLIDFAYIDTQKSNSNFYYVLIFILIFVFLTDNKKNSLSKKERLSILAATILVVILIWTALYLTFTPVGATTINGVQNRYFLPLLLPLLLCLQIPNIQSKIKPIHYNSAIIIAITITMIVLIYQFILVPYNF